MARARPSEFVVECFWPGVHDADLGTLDQRAEASAARLTATGLAVRYLGSMLMREDEVVLCLFEGDAEAVRRAAEEAEIEFERILEAARSPWPLARDA